MPMFGAPPVGTIAAATGAYTSIAPIPPAPAHQLVYDNSGWAVFAALALAAILLLGGGGWLASKSFDHANYGGCETVPLCGHVVRTRLNMEVTTATAQTAVEATKAAAATTQAAAATAQAATLATVQAISAATAATAQVAATAEIVRIQAEAAAAISVAKAQSEAYRAAEPSRFAITVPPVHTGVIAVPAPALYVPRAVQAAPQVPACRQGFRPVVPPPPGHKAWCGPV